MQWRGGYMSLSLCEGGEGMSWCEEEEGMSLCEGEEGMSLCEVITVKERRA